MESDESFFDELRRRRILPIVGTYIAATWLVIELGDWVTERFGLPADLTSYAFVFMLAMLPGLVLVAWNHGARGRDRWTRTELVFLPINLLVAIGLVYLVDPGQQAEAATQTVRIEDETGAVQEFKVAREGYHREIVAFFWPNESGDAELDWLSYAVPMMLAYDLNRVSPVITALTPVDSGSVMNKLREQGYDRLVGVPRGLAVDIARERRSAALVVGSLASSSEGVALTASVIDPASGTLIGTETFTGDDWFEAVDRVTVAVLRLVDVAVADNQSDDPVRQHLTDSLDAVRHFTDGQLALELDNDYPRGIRELEIALELDPAFAEARRSLSVAQYLSGDLESARGSASQALRNGYRLSDASKFILRANRYIFDGDYARGERVLEMWSQVQPNSTRALAALAQLLKLRGGADGLTDAAAVYDRMLELDPNDYSIYRRKAEVEQQRGDLEAAARYVQRFLEAVPDSAAGYLQLSNIRQAEGDLDAAQKAMEDAALLSDDPAQSELGLARLEARRGRYAEAKARLDALLAEPLTPRQKLQVLAVQTEVALVLGEIDRALALTDETFEVAEALMPPAVRIVSIAGQKPNLLLLKGRYGEAIEILDSLAEQLQPPMVWFLNFNYASVYDEADDRENFREWARRTKEVEQQLPDVFRPFIAIESAQIAIWDGEPQRAVELVETAVSQFGQSFLQVAQNNLSLSNVYVGFAELYLEAGAADKARALLDELLKVFPSNGYAKVMLARAMRAEGADEDARRLLEEAIDTWSGADEDFTYLVEARELLSAAG